MKFSTKSRYALRLMLDLARTCADGKGEEYVSLKDVSLRQDISVKYLEQIVPQLAKAGLVKSSRGSRGGYKLAKPAAAYTPGDVIRAIEGNIAVVACLCDCPNACERADDCSALGFWEGLNDAITGYLDGTTLRDMAGRANSIIAQPTRAAEAAPRPARRRLSGRRVQN